LLTRLFNLWEKLRTSFWFIPLSMVAAATAAFFLFLELDRNYTFDSFLFFSFLDPLSPSGARIILSTIAASMITVAGTVFSITIVTLTLASTQFGPRLLRNFMQSNVNQIVLGSFISTFIYCLFLLGSVEPTGIENFVPGLSVNIAVILALFNVALLIYFIHHVATSIQVETVIRNINENLISNIEAYFPERSEANEEHDEESIEPLAPEDCQQVVADRYGYLQAIDNSSLENIAQEKQVHLRMEIKPGAYINRGMLLASLDKENTLDDETCDALRKAFLLGSERTSEQDVEYSIHQLVEIAVRALSPGVNDPFTALGCIDYLGALICRITDREFPSAHRYGKSQKILVTYKIVTFEGIVAAAFDQIRQHSVDNAAVLIRLLEVFYTAMKQTGDSDERKVLYKHCRMVHRAGVENIPEEFDKQDLERRFQRIQELMNESDTDAVA